MAEDNNDFLDGYNEGYADALAGKPNMATEPPTPHPGAITLVQTEIGRETGHGARLVGIWPTDG